MYFGLMVRKMEATIVYWGCIGLYWDNGRENGNYCRVQDLGFIGIVGKKMETAIMGHIG